jgi:acyl-CoA thioester hydrolase
MDSGTGVVQPAWIDGNQHMNLAYYVVLFDRATDAVFGAVGMGDSYKADTNCGAFAAESHLLYDSELRLGDAVTMTSWVLGGDAKRLHMAHEMRRVDDGARAATQELMFLNVDLTQRRVAPWPDYVRDGIQALGAAHALAGIPSWVGRHVGMPRAGNP